MSDKDKVYYGCVIWFSGPKGIGFLEWSDENGAQQPDMFVHYSGIVSQGFKILYKEQKVSFQIGKNNRGQDIAINVKVLTN